MLQCQRKEEGKFRVADPVSLRQGWFVFQFFFFFLTQVVPRQPGLNRDHWSQKPKPQVQDLSEIYTKLKANPDLSQKLKVLSLV